MRRIARSVKDFFIPLIATEQLDPKIIEYVRNTYPSNHTYTIKGKLLVPNRKLAKRFKVVKKYYPCRLTSLLDLSSCKGFFVLDAAQRQTCSRSLGIDIDDNELHASRAVKAYLNAEKAQFEKLYLHELAARIDEFGGPYQTLLLMNTYQYLYFGSDRDPYAYLDHDKIFSMIATMCTDRVIFNNRTEVADCQNKKQIIEAGAAANFYSTQKLFEAASRYFRVETVGEYGRFPLWVMHKL